MHDCSDYNYERNRDGTCTLVEGLEPADHSAICHEDPSRIEYYEPTGYRRIPLTTCAGGRELDKVESQPCPGKGGEYRQKHGIGAWGLFFAITIPILVAGGVGWWAWRNWRSGWMSGFGQIRLGETVGADWAGDRSRGVGGEIVNAVIAVPVAIVSGVWAVAKAMPLLGVSLWRSAKGYVPLGGGGGVQPYTSRGAFSARRQDYRSEVEDEDELLGDEAEDGEDV